LRAADIETAAANLAGVARRTELIRNDRLSEMTGAEVLLKREDLQPVRSYKLRGAYHFMSTLSASERAAGVICASAGNHGQGVAYACAHLGIKGRVFCPTTTPRQKRDRMLALGGKWIELIFVGNSYDEAAAAAAAEAESTGAVKVHAFDDLRTIAGQGTVAPEIVDQIGMAPDVLLVPVGGGGLLAGCLAWIRERWPATRVIGVEPAGAASMQAALWAGHPVRLDHIDTFADGVAVRTAGTLTLPIIQQKGCEWATVAEGQICTEMLDLYQTDGVIAEPAGALASAALRTQVSVESGQTVVAIVSGGNNDVSRYSEIVERSLEVTPLINPDGLVVMEIQQQIDSFQGNVTIQNVGDVPITSSKIASTKVSVRDHDTIIVGGLVETQKNKNASGVPYLKDVPLLGYLFRSTHAAETRKELLVLIRPTVLPTPEVAALAATAEKNKLPGVRETEHELRTEEIRRLKAADKAEKNKPASSRLAP